jgi:hypothetical protein
VKRYQPPALARQWPQLAQAPLLLPLLVAASGCDHFGGVASGLGFAMGASVAAGDCTTTALLCCRAPLMDVVS